MIGPHAAGSAPIRSALSGLGAIGSGKLARPGFTWPRSCAVHLVARDIRHRDAVGEFCLQIYDLLAENDVAVHLHAENWDPKETPAVGPEAILARELGPGDLIFFNFSTADPALPAIASLPARKIFYFHGLTPAGFFERYDPAMASRADEGIAQLSWARKFDRVLSNSSASAEALRQGGGIGNVAKISICPPVIGIERWGEVKERAIALPAAERFILFVGRLSPNKAVHRLLLAFLELARRDHRTGLVVVGHATVPSYAHELAELRASMAQVARDRILFLDDIEVGALRFLYENAALFATLSEHEGFCVPVLEALQFGLPILAGPDAAIGETLGGIGVTASTDPIAVAGEMARLLDDGARRRELASRQHAQLGPLVAAANGALIWQALQSILELDARSF